MKLYMVLEKGDKVLKEDHGGTFLINVNGYCFKSLVCRLEDYRPGTKIRINYLGCLRSLPIEKRRLNRHEHHEYMGSLSRILFLYIDGTCQCINPHSAHPPRYIPCLYGLQR